MSVYVILCAHMKLFIFVFHMVLKEKDAEPHHTDKGLLHMLWRHPLNSQQQLS